MDVPRLLSPRAPRLQPHRTHTRNASRSPTRERITDDILADLSPATTLDAFANPSGRLKASIEAATPAERAFAIRATLASKKIQEWVDELSSWPWPAEGGSKGFRVPLPTGRNSPDTRDDARGIFNGYEQNNNNVAEKGEYMGSLLAEYVDRYEIRIEEIMEDMEDLNVEEIKRQVLDTHFSAKSRPSSSSSSNAPLANLWASYTKMDDLTAIITATVLQALPNLSKLMRMMDVWSIRLAVLRKVPRLLLALDDAETALISGQKALKEPANLFRSDGREQKLIPRQAFEIMRNILQDKVTALGQDLDFMLDTLEGREDTLPEDWLDRMEIIEQDYGKWVVSGDRRIREAEWSMLEQGRREEDSRRLREAEIADDKRRKAAEQAAEHTRILEEERAAQDALHRVELEEEEVKRLEKQRVTDLAKQKAKEDEQASQIIADINNQESEDPKAASTETPNTRTKRDAEKNMKLEVFLADAAATTPQLGLRDAKTATSKNEEDEDPAPQEAEAMDEKAAAAEVQPGSPEESKTVEEQLAVASEVVSDLAGQPVSSSTAGLVNTATAGNYLIQSVKLDTGPRQIHDATAFDSKHLACENSGRVSESAAEPPDYLESRLTDNAEANADHTSIYMDSGSVAPLKTYLPPIDYNSNIPTPRSESVSSDTATMVTGWPDDTISPPAGTSTPVGTSIEYAPSVVDQSPTAGRIGSRRQTSGDSSRPEPLQLIPNTYRRQSMESPTSPTFSISDLSEASTLYIDAPVLENIDVSNGPSLSSPKKSSGDQLQQQISSLLESIPARIHLTSEPNPNPSNTLKLKKPRRSVTPSSRSHSSLGNRAPTPSFLLSPAYNKATSRPRPQSAHPDIKLYHLSRSTGEAPIKLFVRLVGENGERVMVRVGGGWADLGEYLKEYASHHGRRSAAEKDKIEIQDIPRRIVSSSSTASSTSTIRANESGRASPINQFRPTSAFGRPISSLNVRKTRKSVGESAAAEGIRSPSTPLPIQNRRPVGETPPSNTSGRSSSRLSWTDEDSSLGLAGPKAKKVVISEQDQEWVESMKEKVRQASAEKDREKEKERRARERGTSFGEMDKVGGTKRLFKKS